MTAVELNALDFSQHSDDITPVIDVPGERPELGAQVEPSPQGDPGLWPANAPVDNAGDDVTATVQLRAYSLEKLG